MAKLSKKERQKKKSIQIAEKRQNKQSKQTNLSSVRKTKNKNKYSITKRETLANINHENQIKANEKRKKAKQKYYKAKQQLDYKKRSLEALGFDKKFLTTTNLRKVKMVDLEAYKAGDNYKLSVENYPFLYPSYGFDFDKIYSFGDKGLYLAWLDFSGEFSVEDLIARFTTLSNETLIEILDGIVHQAPTYNKNAPNGGAGTSSGRAGSVNVGFHTDSTAKMMFDSDNRSIQKSLENEQKKRLHTGINKYYQTISGGDGNYTITEISGRKLLIVLNAIFYNITEDTRLNTYQTLYKGITSKVPDFKQILPKP